MSQRSTASDATTLVMVQGPVSRMKMSGEISDDSMQSRVTSVRGSAIIGRNRSYSVKLRPIKATPTTRAIWPKASTVLPSTLPVSRARTGMTAARISHALPGLGS